MLAHDCRRSIGTRLTRRRLRCNIYTRLRCNFGTRLRCDVGMCYSDASLAHDLSPTGSSSRPPRGKWRLSGRPGPRLSALVLARQLKTKKRALAIASLNYDFLWIGIPSHTTSPTQHPSQEFLFVFVRTDSCGTETNARFVTAAMQPEPAVRWVRSSNWRLIRLR